jgi:tetratricopeptide (TPR) repeat protein
MGYTILDRIGSHFVSRLRCLPLLLTVFLLSATLGYAKDSWIRVEGPNVTAISNTGKRNTRRLVREFEQFRAVFETAFPDVRVDGDRQMVILAVKRKGQFEELLPNSWDAEDYAGFFQPGRDANHIVVRSDTRSHGYQTVYFSYAHHLINLNFRAIPLWLEYGLAEFWSHLQFRNKDVRIGVPVKRHITHLNQRTLLPLSVLFAVDRDSPYYRDRSKNGLFFGQCWAFTHFLMLSPEWREHNLLGRLTTLIREGRGDETYQMVLGEYGPWDQRLRNYVAREVYGYLKLSNPIKFDEKTLEPVPVSQAAALAAKGYLFLEGGDLAKANRYFDDAIEHDMEEASAWDGRGLAAWRQGEEDIAIRSFETAIEKGSTNYRSYYYLADLGSQTGRPSAEIEHNYREAIRLNPGFARAYSSLGYWYAKSGHYEDALGCYRKACNLEPKELNHLANLVRVLMNLQKFEEAETLAKHLSRSAVHDSDRRTGNTLLSEIQLARTPTQVPSAKEPSETRFHQTSTSPLLPEPTAAELVLSETAAHPDTAQPASNLSEQARACRPYFVDVQGIIPVPGRMLRLECGDPVIFLAEINGQTTRLIAADPALPVLFSCGADTTAVECGPFSYPANFYFPPAFDADPASGALKILAIEFKTQ